MPDRQLPAALTVHTDWAVPPERLTIPKNPRAFSQWASRESPSLRDSAINTAMPLGNRPMMTELVRSGIQSPWKLAATRHRDQDDARHRGA